MRQDHHPSPPHWLLDPGPQICQGYNPYGIKIVHGALYGTLLHPARYSMRRVHAAKVERMEGLTNHLLQISEGGNLGMT